MIVRLLMLVLMGLAITAPLSACGKRGNPEIPEDSKFPRKYPKD